MSLYPFLPNKPRREAVNPFVTWQNAFNEEELNKIVELCELLEKTDAMVGGGEKGVVDHCLRKTTIGWLKNSQEHGWIYDRLAFVARSLNSQFYRFDLYGFVEDIQYTVYQDSDEGHYTWHMDIGAENECTRKLSLVVQLSSPDEYEGGELEIMASSEPVQVTKEKGLICAFPSFILHRVTPVTKGTRRTLVIWIAGPDFV